MGLNISKMAKHFIGRQKMRNLTKQKLDTIEKNAKMLNSISAQIMRIIPTIGIDIKKMNCQKIRLVIWDLADPDHINPLCHGFFRNPQAVFIVVDSVEAVNKLKMKLEQGEFSGNILLLFVNIEDMPNTMAGQEPIDKLQLYEMENNEWYIWDSMEIEGYNLYD